jgi:hypothetical protein
MNFYTDISQKPGAGDCASPKKNRACFERAVEGSEDDLQAFIVTNMRLVSNAIEHFITRHPASAYLTDDMFSEGLLALTRSTKTLVKQLSADEDALKIGLNSFSQKTRQKENPNVIMYIYISIYRAIQELYEVDSSDCISKRMRKHYTPPGQTTPTKQIDIPEICFDQLMCDPFEEIFLLESVFDVCQTDQERLIVEKRLAGYMDWEIAEELDFHRASVATIRNRLYKRFRRAKGLPRET